MSDLDKLLKARTLERNGHHGQAAKIYQAMGNERRNPQQKDALWAAAKNARKNRDS